MIPADLASRLRVLIESSVQPTSPVQELPAGLPRFEVGERFSALIQATLPDGSFQALVAGKTMTLALPGSARDGDVLELIVTAQRGETVFARQASPGPQPSLPADAQPRPVLSQAGQLISQLLTGRFGESTSTPLNSTAAALTTTPQNVPELTQALKQAVSNSGLFYESHLRQWVDGKLPLATVRQEPQAQHPPLPSGMTGALPVSTGTATEAPPRTFGQSPQAMPDDPAQNPAGTAKGLATSPGQSPAQEDRATTAAQTANGGTDAAGKSAGAHAVAEPLMPIVQRQLDALATHQMSWQGQVWPGVQMQWDIFDPEQNASRQQAGEEDETAKFWRSALRLVMPRLGNVEVQLVLSPQGLKISIDADNQDTAADMRGAGPNLQNALEGSGVHLLQLKVSNHEHA